MFHSSSSRHEQYLVRPSQSKATLTLNKKRSSLESEISGADSGYTSSSSTPSSSSSPITPTYHVTSSSSTITNTSKKTIHFNDDISTNASMITNTTNNTISEPIRKKKTKRNQPPRQPDLVYSCPRPLAFPFHNDDHFLPIAEADPRDVARVSPSLNRSSSVQSSKTSVGSTRMYTDYNTSHTNNKAVDTESSYSHQSSILSTIQRGTVRSIRSLFQLPDSLSNNNTNRLSRLQTNNTTKTSYSSHTQSTLTDNHHNPKLARLEIKKGTVQSIKDMFSKKRASFQSQKVTPASRQQPTMNTTGIVGATIGQFESSNYSTNTSKANVNTNKKKSDPVFKPVAVNVTKPAQTKSKGSFTSRATEFANRTIWKPKPIQDSLLPISPATKPLPKDPTTTTSNTSSLKSEVKKLSARIVNSMPKTWRTNDEGNVSLPTTNEAPTPPPPVQKKKRSLFSFKRSTVTTTTEDVSNKKSSTTVTNDDVPLTTSTPPATTVGKMWKSFKSLVTGKKSSRVGVL